MSFCTCYVDFKVSQGCYVGSSREQTAGQSYLKIAFLCQPSALLQRAKICSELIRASPNFQNAALSRKPCKIQGFGPLAEMQTLSSATGALELVFITPVIYKEY